MSKEDKLLNNLLKITEQFMSGRGYTPHTEAELMERLGLPPQHAGIFREVLQTLLHQKTAILSKGRYSIQIPEDEVVKGVVSMHPRGFGFVQAENRLKYPQDIFIPKPFTQNAVNGDTVEVVVNTETVSEKGPEGKIVAILSRGRTHMGGIVRAISGDGVIFAYVPLLGLSQRVVVEQSPQNAPLQIGDRIVMEVVDWGTKETETIGKMSHYVGNIEDPSCDIKAAIEEYELRDDFPHAVIEEAKQYGNRVSAAECAGREDFRGIECFTIDPDTAKDFDDALTLSKNPDGHFHLGVHIADVSHYVRPGTALDREASQRCNSTYFPGRCVSMLPGVLSENLCSLRANVNRLTVSALMEFDSQGEMVAYRLVKSVIKSAKRFTYKEAKAVLDGEKESKHAPTLHLMVELCLLLKRKRHERGSVEFSLPDLVVMVDKQGAPTHVDYISYDITHQLVEEFMLKANEVVARHLDEQGKHLTFRIHDTPSEDNIKDFVALARSFGFQLPSNPTPSDMQKLFEAAIQTTYGQYLATSYIRSMRLAVYSADNIGHYGLGLTHYCHFTSPIRRYVDLVVHRILFGAPHERTTIETIAHTCSEQERVSSKAENSVVLLKKLRLIKHNQDLDPSREYAAVVTRVKNFGFSFEVLDFMLEGFIHVSDLDNDYFVFEEPLMRLRGRRTGKIYCSGDRIKVTLRRIDFITLTSEWQLLQDAASQNMRQQDGFSKRPRGRDRDRGRDRGRDRRHGDKPHYVQELPEENLIERPTAVLPQAEVVLSAAMPPDVKIPEVKVSKIKVIEIKVPDVKLPVAAVLDAIASQAALPEAMPHAKKPQGGKLAAPRASQSKSHKEKPLKAQPSKGKVAEKAHSFAKSPESQLPTRKPVEAQHPASKSSVSQPAIPKPANRQPLESKSPKGQPFKAKVAEKPLTAIQPQKRPLPEVKPVESRRQAGKPVSQPAVPKAADRQPLESKLPKGQPSKAKIAEMPLAAIQPQKRNNLGGRAVGEL